MVGANRDRRISHRRGLGFYTVAACGIVVVSRRSPIFSQTEPGPNRLAAPNPSVGVPGADADDPVDRDAYPNCRRRL